MNNKKSLLQDSLQELENIKNESLELAKEQLINESADLLEKKSAELFEKLIAGEDVEEESKEEEKEEEKEEDKEEDKSLNEILNELKDFSDEEDEDEMSDDEDEMEDSEDEEEMSLDALRKAAEEQGFKLVQADSDEEDMEGSEDEEEMDSDEEEMEDSDDEEDIEFNDEESDDEFSDVDVDDKVLAEPSDEEEEKEESFQKINENFKRNNTKMRNTKKQVLKDLRDVSFNKLVEAYYNMGDNDSFIIKENEYIDEDLYEGDPNDKYDDYAPDPDSEYERRFEIDSDMDETEPYDDEEMDDEEMDEDIMYEIDMPEGRYDMESMSDEGYEMTDEDINEMLAEMGIDEDVPSREQGSAYRTQEKHRHFKGDIHNYHDELEESIATRTRDKFVKQGLGGHTSAEKTELEEMFEEMSMEELMEMERMLQEDGDGAEEGFESGQDGQGGAAMSKHARFKKDYMDKQDLTEPEIEEILSSMKEEEDIEEGMSLRRSQANKHQAPSPRNREERIRPLAEEDMEEVNEGMFDGLKSAFSQIGTSARQAVGQFSKEMSQAYNSGEVGNEVKKLETLANNLGKQVAALNARLQKAGKQPLPAAKVIASLSNQIRSGGNISLANTQVGQGLQEDTQELQEQVKKLKQENKALNEGFTNKVKSLENKVYDVTISALKAGFVNKFLLEHPLRENEKLQIIHRFANAQTKEQIKETYISLTNEFAKGQTVKDGSMLNESVQNKVGKVHRTDNVVVTEKNLMNENDETNRFKQLLNYNFGKK